MSKPHVPVRPNVSEQEVIPGDLGLPLEPREKLVNEIKETADKLQRDEATIGDMKLLSRTLRELRYAFKIFKKYRRNRKVTVFGSARLRAGDPAYDAAVHFGRIMAKNDWYVLTGAGPGIMQAAHEGSGREKAMGVNIMLPFEQGSNPIIDGDEKNVHMKYFFTRKLLFVKEVHAIALFAGGFGTLDECLETFTLVQTGKRDLMPIVCVDAPGDTFWSDFQEYINNQLLKRGLISPEDTSLYKITDDVGEAVREIFTFYCVYNSMRYVNGKLVLRLHKDPPDDFVARLNDEFSSILESGKIEKTGPHPHEADDAHLAHLPRLILDFNRRDLGRLRQMIDLINTSLDDCPEV